MSLEASWRHYYSSSGYSLCQFVLLLHVIPDRLDDDDVIRSLCGALAVVRQKSHWIITINGKMYVWKCKLILLTDKLQQKMEITDLNSSVLKVCSHRTRMTRIARMIYMLSQCKDAIDNPAALFARMRRRELRVNQSGACSSSDVITSGGRKSETTMEDKVIVVVCGYPEQRDWSCLAEAPPMTRIRVCCVVNFTCEWCEFQARTEVSKLKMFKHPTTRHSRLVWTHL